MNINYCYGKSKTDAHPVMFQAPNFDKFVSQLLAFPRARAKGRAYICGPLRRNGTDALHRRRVDVLPRAWLGHDLDGGTREDVDLLLQRLPDYRAIAWRTASSTPEHPRLRILMFLDREVDREEGRRLGAALVSVLGAGLDSLRWDHSTHLGEQMCYLPLVGAQVMQYRGDAVDVDAMLALAREEPPRERPGRTEGVKVTEGGRNAYLMSRAGLMRHGGFGRETILAAMLVENKTTCSPALEEEEVEKIVASASRYEPGKASPVGEEPAHTEDPDTRPAPLAKVAFHGLAGEIVDAILPDSESDPAALLTQTLVCFGATVGRGAYFQVEGTRHHGNLFQLIIGKTATGRKGTSMGRVLEIFNLVQDCPKIARGSSTGEGLKWLIRDAVPAKPRKRKFKRHYLDPYNDENDDQGDPGVADKRVIVYESEFGQVLRVIPRQGNTLTVALKEFWDGNDVGSLTKHDPVKVTAPHLSFIGNITEEELRSCMSQVELMSGFANRFLMVYSERSQVIPEGGEPLDEKVAHSFAQRIARCAGLASGVGRMTRTEEGSGYWASIYESLATGEGAVARAAPQVLRLSLLYALLDQSARIDAVHIEAGLAVWKCCEATVRHVLGSGDVGGQGNPALGDMLCERVLKWIQKVPAGQTERQLYRRFGGRVPIEQIRGASASLTESRLVMAQTKVGGNGQEVTWWIPA